MSPWTRPPEDAGKDDPTTWDVTFRLVLYTSLILTLKRSGIPQVAGILRNTTCSPLFLGKRHLNHRTERADIVSKISPFPGSDFKGVPLPNSVLAKEQKYPEGSYTHLKIDTNDRTEKPFKSRDCSSYRDKIQSNFMERHLKWNNLQVLLSREVPSHSSVIIVVICIWEWLWQLCCSQERRGDKSSRTG